MQEVRTGLEGSGLVRDAAPGPGWAGNLKPGPECEEDLGVGRAALLLLPLQLVFLPGPLPTVLGGGAGSDSNWSQLQASLGRSSGSPAFTLTWVWNCRESGVWSPGLA